MKLEIIIEIIKSIRDEKVDAVMVFRNGKYDKTLWERKRKEKGICIQ